MKRISQRILIALVVMFFGVAAMAQESTFSSLVVLLKNGTANAYELAQKPVITYTGATMTITSDGVETSYSLPEVENFHFDASQTAIENIVTDFQFTQSAPNVFTISGSEGAMVFDPSGRVISTFNPQGEIVVDLNGQSTGVYIIAVKGAKKNQSIKILKK